MTEQDKVKKQKPNKFPKQYETVPKESYILGWSKSMEAQIKHQNLIKSEAKKLSQNPNYRVRVKLGKKYKEFFSASVIEATVRERKRKEYERNKNTKRKKSKAKKRR